MSQDQDFRYDTIPDSVIDHLLHTVLVGETDSKHHIPAEPPPYATDMNEAMRALGAVLEALPQEDIHMEHLEGEGWSVSTCFDTNREEWQGWKVSRSLARAICYAALASYGVDLDGYVVAEAATSPTAT